MVYFTLLVATASACRKPYAPKPVSDSPAYLVVEGVINQGADSTIITLSNTVNIADSTSSEMETGAIVAVEDESGAPRKLNEEYLAIRASTWPLG